MTQEEKARAYDDAIERAKSFQEKYGGDYAGYIFPELRESEDERIIKFLKHAATLDAADELFQEYGVKHTQVIAWLEKQKECFAAISNTSASEDERIRKEIIDFIQWAEDRGMTRHDYHQAKRPAEWIAYLEKQKINTEGDFGRGYDCGYEACLNSHGAEWFEKQKEQKPAWSEEDEDMLNSCISSIEEAKENRYAYKETDGDTSYDHEIAWLKSLRPSWKPSEDEERLINTSISFLKYFADKGYENAVECIDWLKSKMNETESTQTPL